MIRIERADDPRISDYVSLRDRQAADAQRLIVESVVAIERLLTSPYAVRSMLLSPEVYARMQPQLDVVDAPIYVAPVDLMTLIAGFDVHRGALAAAERGSPTALADVLATARRLVVLEGCNDQENLGAIARTARALGADALVLDPTCADPFYRRSVRVSMGHILHLPVLRSADWLGDLALLIAHGFDLWALTPAVAAGRLDRLPVPDRVAILVGAEGPGLTAAALDAATPVRIMMHHGVDSLNVGHAVAIALAHVASGQRPNAT